MKILSYLYNANKNIKILCKEAKLVANGNRVQTDLIIVFFLLSLNNRILFARGVQTDFIFVCLQQLTKSLKYVFFFASGVQTII